MADGVCREGCAWLECRDGRIARLGAGDPPREPDVDLGGNWFFNLALQSSML